MTIPNKASPPSRSTLTKRWATTSARPAPAPTMAAVRQVGELGDDEEKQAERDVDQERHPVAADLAGIEAFGMPRTGDSRRHPRRPFGIGDAAARMAFVDEARRRGGPRCPTVHQLDIAHLHLDRAAVGQGGGEAVVAGRLGPAERGPVLGDHAAADDERALHPGRARRDDGPRRQMPPSAEARAGSAPASALTCGHARAACFSSAIRSSSARLFFSAADFSWPQAAMMSRPRGRRIGAEIPASKTMSEKRRIRSSSEHS